MPERDPDIELPPPLPANQRMPQQVPAKERAAALVWIAVALYFVYVLLF